MSFINNLKSQQNSVVTTPAVVAQPILQSVPTDGLAATFREPNRFNALLNRQFGTPNPSLARQQLERNYRG